MVLVMFRQFIASKDFAVNHLNWLKCMCVGLGVYRLCLFYMLRTCRIHAMWQNVLNWQYCNLIGHTSFQ